eukprot:TRINITY_DN4148_c0_g1_i3.p1 TRINITY_DN4148_c0_g1~~TRINITY_DN4148_c0_g1_i3.p1  ORF type:complete len:361 (-),score=37.37 TRINITY_DN4148_c0_g1_i3:16-1008(-)
MGACGHPSSRSPGSPLNSAPAPGRGWFTTGSPVNWTCPPRSESPMVDAFLILTHADHTSTAAIPLIRKLLTSDPHLDRLVVLHVDTRIPTWVPIFESMFGNYSNFHVISKWRGGWGQLSLVYIELSLMEDAMNTEYCSMDNHTKCCWSYVHVLSGDSYLLQSVAAIGERMRSVWPTNFLSNNEPAARVAGKMERNRVGSPKWHGYKLLNTTHVVFGYQWIALTRPFVRFLMTDSRVPDIVSAFRFVKIPDESALHSICAFAGPTICNATGPAWERMVTVITRDGTHVFTPEEAPMLLGSRALYFRKCLSDELRHLIDEDRAATPNVLSPL